MLLQLLGLKLVLTAFALASGLVGGVFAPSLFFGAAAGSAYHFIVSSVVEGIQGLISTQEGSVHALHSLLDQLSGTFAMHNVNSVSPPVLAAASEAFSASDAALLASLKGFFLISNAQAYATVGAAATLGSLFRAPLTSAMLMFELTQNHDIVLPVLLSTGLGGFFAENLRMSRKQQQQRNATSDSGGTEGGVVR